MVTGVIRQAVRDAGARGVIVLDDGSPEAELVGDWCIGAFGAAAVERVGAPDPHSAAHQVEPAVAAVRDLDPARAAGELRRYRARLVGAARGLLPAHPANKTTLLLAGAVPPEPLLPLGDLYASQIRELAGECSVPAAVRAVAERAGGLERLDAALSAWLEERRPLEAALEPLGEPAAAAVRNALDAGRFGRRRIGLVPKLGARTLGIDLFD